LGTLSEPRRKQNLYANPKRTAKFSPSLFQTHLVGKRFKIIFKKHQRDCALPVTNAQKQRCHFILFTV